MPLDRCCLESLARKGITDGFALATEGDGWTCHHCGGYLQINGGVWRAAYRCPRCGRVSFNPTDRQERYCGACQQFERLS